MYEKYTEESLVNQIIVATGIFLLLTLMIFLFILLYNKRRSKLLAERKELEHQFQQTLLETQIEIQEQTLQNISQELHDNVGQALTLAKLNLNTLPKQKNDKAAIQIENTKTILNNSLNSIRYLAKSMLGEKVAEIGLEAALINELKLIEQTNKYTVTINSTGEPFLLIPQNEIVAFRIMQEALHNIIKHASATAINLNITYENNKIINIALSDNGIGFEANTQLAVDTGVGLKNIKNRAALIHAQFNISSQINKGTTVSLIINK
jgi:two-component system, NarL family, sensor kinase